MPRRSALLLVAVAAGCLGPKPDPTRFFVLSPVASPSGQAPAGATPTLGVGPVRLPDYLDQTAIVTRVTDQEVDFVSSARWAERPSTMVTRVVAGNLSTRTGGREVVLHPWPVDRQPAVTAAIEFTRLEVTRAGTAVLRAQWRVQEGERVRTGFTAIDEAAADTTMDARVAALNRALGRLSDEVAAAIGR